MKKKNYKYFQLELSQNLLIGSTQVGIFFNSKHILNTF